MRTLDRRLGVVQNRPATLKPSQLGADVGQDSDEGAFTMRDAMRVKIAVAAWKLWARASGLPV